MVSIGYNARKGFDTFGMSALGQKQTCAVQKGMSALHPIATAKADILADRGDQKHLRTSTETERRAAFQSYPRTFTYRTRALY